MPPLGQQEAVELFLARARAVEPGSRRRRRWPSSAPGSTACRSRSSSPRRVSVCSPRSSCSNGSRSGCAAHGGPAIVPSVKDAAGDDRLESTTSSPRGAAAFARLAVFRGGCTLEAAEEVCGADLDTLQSLVDKSLLRHRRALLDAGDDPRVRPRAAGGGGEGDAVRRRHAEHYLGSARPPMPSGSIPADLGAAARRGARQPSRRARFPARARPRRLPSARRRTRLVLGARPHFAEASRRLEDALASPAEDGRHTARALRSLAVSRLVRRAVCGRAESARAGDRALARHRGRTRADGNP